LINEELIYNRFVGIDYFEQQPIGRTVGRRTPPRAGALPTAETRAAMDSWANRLTRAPKGIFRYSSHDEMERDRDRWQVAAMVEAVRARG
jgi:hypothetical protein